MDDYKKSLQKRIYERLKLIENDYSMKVFVDGNKRKRFSVDSIEVEVAEWLDSEIDEVFDKLETAMWNEHYLKDLITGVHFDIENRKVTYDRIDTQLCSQDVRVVRDVPEGWFEKETLGVSQEVLLGTDCDKGPIPHYTEKSVEQVKREAKEPQSQNRTDDNVRTAKDEIERVDEILQEESWW